MDSWCRQLTCVLLNGQAADTADVPAARGRRPREPVAIASYGRISGDSVSARNAGSVELRWYRLTVLSCGLDR